MTVDLEKSSRFRNFDWEKIKTFYYVAKVGSFMGAGRYINLSQPAITRQMAELEAHLRAPLFTRHKNGVKLTRKGKDLLRIIEPTFQELVGFTRQSHAETEHSKKRKIRISSTHAVMSYILKDLILKYNKQRPDLIFELVSNDHLLDIVMNDVDIAIRPYDPQARGICQDYLFTLEKKLYASAEYLQTYGEPQSVEELKSHRIIAPAHPEQYPYADLEWILGLGLPEGKRHEPVFTSNSIECLVEAAQEGLGIVGSYELMGIIKRSSLKNILPEVRGEPRKIYFSLPIYLKEDKDILVLKDYFYQNLSPS